MTMIEKRHYTHYRLWKLRIKMYEDVLRLREQGFGYKKIYKTIKNVYGKRASLGIKIPSLSTIRNWIKGRSHPRYYGKELRPSPYFSYSAMAILGDGSISPRNGISFTSKDKEFADKVAKYLAKVVAELTGKNKVQYYKVSRNGKKNKMWRVVTSSLVLASLLRDAKKNPKVLLPYLEQYPEEACQAFFDAEGSLSIKHKIIEASNTNLKLLKVIQQLLKKLGIESRINKWKRKDRYFYKNGKRYKRKPIIYRLRITGKANIKRFYNKIGFTIERKWKKLKKLIKSYKK